VISALHKSCGSSDVDAALYWLHPMLEGAARTACTCAPLIRMAIEDIGLTDPARFGSMAVAAMQAVHFLGSGPGRPALAQAAIYLCVAPKSDSAYRAMKRRCMRCRANPSRAVPMKPPQSRDGPHERVGLRPKAISTRSQFEDAIVDMECLPPVSDGTALLFSPRIAAWRSALGKAGRDQAAPQGAEPRSLAPRFDTIGFCHSAEYGSYGCRTARNARTCDSLQSEHDPHI